MATEETVGALISSVGVALFWLALIVFLLYRFVFFLGTSIRKLLFHFLMLVSRDYLVRYRSVRKLLSYDWSLWTVAEEDRTGLHFRCMWIPGPQEDVPSDSIPFLMLIENRDRFRVIHWFPKQSFSGKLLREIVYSKRKVHFLPKRLPTATVIQEKSCLQKTH
jgi:hypothetical protein